VTLVGAGPGDPELLTLKAIRALQAADVVLFDDLVSPEVLEFVPAHAERIAVGKRAGRHSCRQEDINALMLRMARSGRRVVRLKSGDPSIFGRAGEEMEYLAAEGIPVSVVPGVTAATALAASLGLSLTRRGRATSLHLATGHSHKGGLPEDLDWRSVADPSATTVFYMAAGTAGQIATRLMSLGADSATPVVIASAVSRPDQSITFCTLGTLASMVEATGKEAPTLIGIGAAFGCEPRVTGHGGSVAESRSVGRLS
jgi:uroporphyrin-III C-methyltransferase/precorrin-2 dehydrogenase/sirohydrochlorin ferrochelatase